MLAKTLPKPVKMAVFGPILASFAGRLASIAGSGPTPLDARNTEADRLPVCNVHIQYTKHPRKGQTSRHRRKPPQPLQVGAVVSPLLARRLAQAGGAVYNLTYERKTA
jgi:hypothetical protein